jgi:hypothetical protein
VKSRGPEPADHEQDEDEPELRSNADQAQERRRHQDADASDQSQPDVFAKRTEDGLRHGRGDPEHRDHQGEGRGTRIEPHLKRRQQRTQDRGHRIVDRVNERHEDRERCPAEDARLADYVRHSRIMNGGRIPAYPHSARKRQDRPVTPEVAGSSPVAPVETSCKS